MARSAAAYDAWRLVPAPVRGAVVRRFGELLREHLDDLATLVSVEVGKITSEARGEVQEMVDICDYAVGLSRQLFGRTMTSERPGPPADGDLAPARRGRRDLGVQLPGRGLVVEHRHRPGVRRHRGLEAVGAGAAVRARLVRPAVAGARRSRASRPTSRQVVLGDAAVGLALVDDPGVALLSATGSTRMGREVGPRVAARFGRSLLELGGNNAAIVGPSADLDLTTRGIVFSAAGTAGQRCTTHAPGDRALLGRGPVVERVAAAYEKLPIGDPMTDGTLVGPLVNGAGLRRRTTRPSPPPSMPEVRSSSAARRVLEAEAPDAYYVQPTVVRMPEQSEVVHTETFAPLLYVMAYDDLDEAIALNNAVPAGALVVDLHPGPGRGRAVHVGRRLRLRHRQRQHRHLRRRDRRRVRRREGDRRRPRVRLRRLARVHAPRHQHHQLLRRPPPRPGRQLRRLRSAPLVEEGASPAPLVEEGAVARSAG